MNQFVAILRRVLVVAVAPLATVALLSGVTPSLSRAQSDGIYTKGSDWLSLRFGYAKRTGDANGNGLVGYGVGYQHMISRKYGFAAGAGHDVVGHFGIHLDELVSFTGEFQRHYKWNSGVSPYIGLGAGYYLHKYYRTGLEDNTTPTSGMHLTLGFASALNAKRVIGLETRVARIGGDESVVNSTFGPEKATETIWTVKAIWGLVY